ncbi:histidine--tRNA ligase, cytoplasmic isoform X1 [Cinnamomum micranthum f. kanehirae]|uniref:Histidine--tRNA ligase, cytoplasmic n=1 Tax=Cinnamomum micranthum f. kanehirae TaxID=337451 RepID=A0A443NJC9_9MAGN|nr:histidine--tRNA ligase, cytoplasmic isoform X1 [Cinnamomum micranthum f. kanehirae]
MAFVTIGGKGSSLTPSSVHSIATSTSKAKIDSSILEKLSLNPNSIRPLKSSPPPPPPPRRRSDPKTLTLEEESRAALVVLLNKLLFADAAIRPQVPLLIEETLNRSFSPESLDFGSSINLLHSILSLNGKNLDEFGVTSEEIGVVDCSFAAINGICALLDCNSSMLVTVVDSVAALSCEAAKADVAAAFDMPVSGDGNSIKDETDVASDMKDLLFGSKFVGSINSDVFSDIPIIHGSFRRAAKAVHALMRVELNSPVRVRKTSCVGNGKGKALVAAVLPLAMSLLSVGESSLGRAKLTIGSVDDVELRSRLVEVFEKSCPGVEVLRNGFQSISVKAASESDYIMVLHEIYDLLLKLRMIIAWEAALALFSLEAAELNEKTQGGPLSTAESNGGNVNLERKSEKKNKRKKVLGKELTSFFDPKDPELDALLTKVKDIVESNEVRRLPKIPKGTRDFGKEQMAVRERAFSIIVGVFKRHGGVALDTPVFELRETLMGKYGEDSKLIYDLADQGGEICSLRYDLTVPFARYLAMNNINALKRYQIAKVYRRDNPSKGRYREFYQCDFDIAGQYDVMEPDFEVLKVLTELLDELSIGDYEIKLNHRKLLDGMLEICGVSSEKFRTVCSSIDKLDKQSFDQVKKELVEEKGLTVETADKIGSFVKKRGAPLEILSDLKQEGSQFLNNSGSVIALKDLEILFKALEKSKCIHRVVFDLSLARGLDYYTGVIFEAVFKGGSKQVGSIAAGGRYDNLVGMFSGKQVPAVGVSLGIERVFAIMEEQLEKGTNQSIRATETQVLVVLLGKDLALAAELVSELWNAKLRAEFAVTKKVVKQIERANQTGIPLMVIVGNSELEQGVANIKELAANTQVTVPREKVVEELQRRLSTASQSFSDRYYVV